MLISSQDMTAEKAFTTIILFNVLQFPLRALPESITQLTQIWVSLKRIGKFLYSEEIERYYIENQTHSENAIEIRDGTFYWELEQKKDEKDDKDNKDKKDKDKKDKDKKDKEDSKKKRRNSRASDVIINTDSDAASEASDLRISLLSANGGEDLK